MPPRTTSAAYALSCRVSPITAVSVGPSRLTVCTVRNCGPNGMPRPSVGYSAPMLNQNSSCTSSGVDRKIQM